MAVITRETENTRTREHGDPCAVARMDNKKEGP